MPVKPDLEGAADGFGDTTFLLISPEAARPPDCQRLFGLSITRRNLSAADEALGARATGESPSYATRSNNILHVGKSGMTATLRCLHGWVDMLRQIPGRAEHSANFTLPAAPFDIP
jgi:hypothetical protein